MKRLLSLIFLTTIANSYANLGSGQAVDLVKKGIDSKYELNCIGSQVEFSCFNKLDSKHGLKVNYKQDKQNHIFDIKPISNLGTKCYAAKSEEEILGESLVDYISDHLKQEYLTDETCELYTDNMAGDFSKYKKVICRDKSGAALSIEVIYDGYCGRNVSKVSIKVK